MRAFASLGIGCLSLALALGRGVCAHAAMTGAERRALRWELRPMIHPLARRLVAPAALLGVRSMRAGASVTAPLRARWEDDPQSNGRDSHPISPHRPALIVAAAPDHGRRGADCGPDRWEAGPLTTGQAPTCAAAAPWTCR